MGMCSTIIILMRRVLFEEVLLCVTICTVQNGARQKVETEEEKKGFPLYKRNNYMYACISVYANF